jgi:hypothetical protein
MVLKFLDGQYNFCGPQFWKLRSAILALESSDRTIKFLRSVFLKIMVRNCYPESLF